MLDGLALGPPGGGPLDCFDMRGLILFNVIGTLLTLPCGPCIQLWSARVTSPGPGRLLCFEKFAKPTSQNKAGAPALARISPLSEL